MSKDKLIEEVAFRFIDILGIPIGMTGEEVEDELVKDAMDGKIIYINSNTKVILSLPNPIIKTKIDGNDKITR